MSSANTAVHIIQWGSGSPAEGFPGDVSTIPALMTAVAPTAPPSWVNLGSYGLQIAPSASTVNYLAPYLGLTTDARVVIGFFWRPGTNPSSGIWCGPGHDDGSLSGLSFGWDSANNKCGFYEMSGAGTLVGTQTALAFSTADVKNGVTNPWYYVVLVLDRTGATDQYEMLFFRANAEMQYLHPDSTVTTGWWELVDMISHTEDRAGNGFYYRVGNYAAATGSAVIANLSAWTITSGYRYGPLAPSMGTGLPTTVETADAQIIMNGTPANCTFLTTLSGTATAVTGTTMDDTTTSPFVAAHVGTRANMGGSYALIASITSTSRVALTAAQWIGGTPAAGAYTMDSEERYKVKEVPPDDTSTAATPDAGWLQITTSFARTNRQQRHKHTQSLIPSGANVLCVQVRLRTTATSVVVPFHVETSFRLGAGTENTGVAMGTAVANAWNYATTGAVVRESIYQVQPGTATGFATGSTDSDQAQIGYVMSKDAGPNQSVKISQCFATWVYGDEETALGLPRGGAALGSANPGIY